MNSEDGQVYSVCILQFSCFILSTTVCSQNINKQNVNIADETLTDFSFLSRYHVILNQGVFEKTISNSSLNSHVYWDTLYLMNIFFLGGGIYHFLFTLRELTDMRLSEQL